MLNSETRTGQGFRPFDAYFTHPTATVVSKLYTNILSQTTSDQPATTYPQIFPHVSVVNSQLTAHPLTKNHHRGFSYIHAASPASFLLNLAPHGFFKRSTAAPTIRYNDQTETV
jgi:hypothetical protein